MSGGSRDVKMQMQNKEKHRLTMHACKQASKPAASCKERGRYFQILIAKNCTLPASADGAGDSLFGLQVSLKFVKNELSRDLSEAEMNSFSRTW